MTEEIQEKKSKLKELLAESNSESEFRQRCEKEFPDMSSLFVSWGTSIRIANLYLKGHTSPIYACVS